MSKSTTFNPQNAYSVFLGVSKNRGGEHALFVTPPLPVAELVVADEAQDKVPKSSSNSAKAALRVKVEKHYNLNKS